MEQAANRVCGAVNSDKAMEGFYQSFPKGVISILLNAYSCS